MTALPPSGCCARRLGPIFSSPRAAPVRSAWTASGPTGLAIGDLHNAAAIFSLAADTQVTRHLDVVPAGETAPAAIELAKLAQRLPALLVGRRPARR